VLNADVALATAAVDSKFLKTQTVNENNRVTNPALPTKNTYAKGQGLEVGIAGTPPADGQILLAGKAEQSALPNGPTITKEEAVAVPPVAFASLVRGRADAKWNADNCVLGTDLARGLGYASNVQLVDTGTPTADGFQKPIVAADASTPERSVSQTLSHEALVPNVTGTPAVATGTFGLQSEVRQTIAPVTLFKGAANEVTFEFLGEWVLRVIASGTAGTGTIFYGPGTTTPSTPIIRIIQPAASPPVTDVLTFQDVFGPTGVSVPIPGVAELTIGEAPRAIGGAYKSAPTNTGTTVSAAVDVVRLKLADGQLGDVRIGHMEAKATVPAGGITCALPVTKAATPSTVNATTAPDGNFLVTITVMNPYDCPLTDVSALDVISRKSGDVTFTIVEGDPRNDPAKGAGAVFTTTSPTAATASYGALGTIAPGATKEIKVVLHVAKGSGEIQDIATVKGTLNCPGGTAIGDAKAKASLVGSFTLITKATAVQTKTLVRTGGSDIGLWVAIPAVAALGFRRVRRIRRPAASAT